jgi:signal peptidase I
MVPKYNIGDVLICKEVDVNTLQVGDDITYKGEYSSYKDRVVTHRIKRIEKDEDGNLLFYTQGIATVTEDPVVHEDQIYGKIVRKTYVLSKLYKFISKPTGFYLCIFIPIAFLVGSEIIASMVDKFEEKKQKLNQG